MSKNKGLEWREKNYISLELIDSAEVDSRYLVGVYVQGELIHANMYDIYEKAMRLYELLIEGCFE
ncbi:hypothetical protein ES708_14351 [subsurface metagenome]